MGRAKASQCVNAPSEFIAQQAECIACGHQVGVVGDEARSGAQVNDGRRARAGTRERVHMGHDVVANEALLVARELKVDRVDVGAHFVELGLAYLRQAELLLGSGQVQPQLAPRGELALIAKAGQHLFARVARH